MSLLHAIIPIIDKVVGGLFTDKDEQARIQAEITRQLISKQSEIENAAARVVTTEASSKHWLAANWRPLLMLTFGGLIVARWFGWAAPNLSEAEYLALWDIVELGIGGYVIGRSAEKVLPKVSEAFKR